MKGKIILFAALFLLVITSVQAAPVGSPPSLLKKGQWDFAIEGGYLAERAMKTSDNANYEVSISHGYHSRSYGLTDRLMITAKGGGTYGKLYDNNIGVVNKETTLSAGFGLGLQLKGIIFEHKESGWEWDAGGQFLYLRSHRKRSGKANTDWYEWQASTFLAKSIGRFKPYGGIKFSTVDLDYDSDTTGETSYESDENLGVFIGTDIFLGEDQDLVFNLEANFLLGNHFYGGFRYRF